MNGPRLSLSTYVGGVRGNEEVLQLISLIDARWSTSAQVYRFWCFSAQLYSTMFSLIESFHKRFADIRD